MNWQVIILVAIIILVAGCTNEPEIQEPNPNQTILLPLLDKHILLIDNGDINGDNSMIVFPEKYLCVNRDEPPQVLNEKETSKHSKTSEIACGNYYFKENFHSATGPAFYGPFSYRMLTEEECAQGKLKTACYYALFLDTKDKKLCEKIEDKEWQEYCRVQAVLFEKKIESCSDNPVYADLCTSALFGDPALHTYADCENISEIKDRENCFYFVSLQEMDIEYCNRIIDKDLRESCYSTPIMWEYTRQDYKNLDIIDINCSDTHIASNPSKKEKCDLFVEEYLR